MGITALGLPGSPPPNVSFGIAVPTVNATDNEGDTYVQTCGPTGLATENVRDVYVFDRTAAGVGTWVQLTVNPFREVTGATTLTVCDSCGIVVVNAAGAVNVTVPAGLPNGFGCVVIQQGVGAVNVIGAAGVTVNGTPGVGTRTRYSAIGVITRNAGANAVITGDSG